MTPSLSGATRPIQAAPRSDTVATKPFLLVILKKLTSIPFFVFPINSFFTDISAPHS